MNLNHRQLDPSVNRVRIAKTENNPASPARVPQIPVQPKIDPENPYVNIHLGWFDGKITDEKGNARAYGFFIPTTMRTSGNMMLVFVPGRTDPKTFFEDGNWEAALEKNSMTAYFLGAPGGWDLEDPGYEIDTAVRVLGEMKSMEYFPCNSPTVYAAGFGDAAGLASMFAVIHQSYLAAFAACGNTELPDEFLKRFGESASDCDAFLKRSEVALPAYFVGESTNTVEYFKKACNVKAEPCTYGAYTIWQEQPKPGSSFVNDDARSEVRIAAEEPAEMIDEAVTFIAGFQRWAGEGNGHIRRTMRAEVEMGLVRTDAKINGLNRYWYTFEPTAWKRKAQEKFPLVIAIHGFSCSGEFFAQNSCWHRVGEERNCFVVYPTGYPYENSPEFATGLRATGIATPHWNVHGYDGTLKTDPNGPDDVDFFRQMLKATLEKYPEIDTERIYVTGHSNGGMMTQRLMRCMPEPFAAFAPVGAMECRTGDLPAPEDGIKRPVWFTIGEFDGAGWSLEGDNGNTRTIKMACKVNGLDYESGKTYISGIFHNLVIRDENRVPMVRFTGVRNYPHTYTPELAFMIYDELFSRFVRHADGTVEYLA